MAFSKSNRIMILLAIDSAFFLLEITIGYSVHSLALVADSFHMLNDVISLLVGLWAVKVADTRASSKIYTYGWQRAETLGALVNGVFLVALCLSIFLEAIQRFFEPQTVSSPKLVLVVGCCGLLSNILGLLLFHDHGHSHRQSHGDEDAGHTVDGTSVAEEGRQTTMVAPPSPQPMPTAAGIDNARHDAISATETSPLLPKTDTEQVNSSARDTKKLSNGLEPTRSDPLPNSSLSRRARRHTSSSRSRYPHADDLRIHPASFRNEIIAASRLDSIESPPADSEPDSCDESQQSASEHATLLGAKAAVPQRPDNDGPHTTHKHRNQRSESEKVGGHSHGDLNLRGVFLHVMGDALGNIGVIASALFIWLTDYWWRFYSDPLISLVITVIILCSALPLCRAASRILLQAVPAHISVDDIKEDIEDLPGVVGCHHLHVWQLSDTKLVASLHVQVAFGYKGTDSEQYMCLARAVRTCLHEYGIHSSTIQPEFCLDDGHDHVKTKAALNGQSTALSAIPGDGTNSKLSSRLGSSAASVKSLPDACLLDCDDICGDSKRCCGRSAGQDGKPH